MERRELTNSYFFSFLMFWGRCVFFFFSRFFSSFLACSLSSPFISFLQTSVFGANDVLFHYYFRSSILLYQHYQLLFLSYLSFQGKCPLSPSRPTTLLFIECSDTLNSSPLTTSSIRQLFLRLWLLTSPSGLTLPSLYILRLHSWVSVSEVCQVTRSMSLVACVCVYFPCGDVRGRFKQGARSLMISLQSLSS